MEDQSSLAKQNKIFSMFEKHEKRMKNILLLIIICVITFSSFMSLAFSYKSYKKVDNIINKEEKEKAESFAYETLIVSYSNGSLLSCNENGCGSTIVKITNEGKDSIFYTLSFVDIGGDGTGYNYYVMEPGNNVQEKVPTANAVIKKKLKIKPGETKDYNIALNSVDGLTHANYQMRVQINMDMDKDLFLE